MMQTLGSEQGEMKASVDFIIDDMPAKSGIYDLLPI